MAHITVSPKVGNLREVFEPLLSGLFWPTERLWVICVAVVLVQALRDNVQVLLFERLTPFAQYESDLWGLGSF